MVDVVLQIVIPTFQVVQRAVVVSTVHEVEDSGGVSDAVHQQDD